MRGKLNARDHFGLWPGVKDGAAEAPMRKLAGGPRNSDALDNWERLLIAEGVQSVSRQERGVLG